jgi:hypothetical protein
MMGWAAARRTSCERNVEPGVAEFGVAAWAPLRWPAEYGITPWPSQTRAFCQLVRNNQSR